MGDLTGLVAVICIFGTPLAAIGMVAFRSYLKHQSEILDKKLATHSEASSRIEAEVVALRQELAQLRDTSTQYDISIQHTLEELQHRVHSIESRNSRGLHGSATEDVQPIKITT